jgi:hypothetical protein
VTAPIGEAGGNRAEQADLLTFDEENALGTIREIVGGVRAGGRAAPMEEVEKAVVAAGGMVLNKTDGAGSRIYGLSGARFSLSADSGPGGAIILSFLPAAR